MSVAPRLASRRRIGRRLAAPVGVWDTDADGFRREFMAKVIGASLPRR